jgi:zinc protease
VTSVQLPRIERTDIDGIPVLWSPAPGPVTASLSFRVGRADERPAEAGITHVVEHLAMGPLGQPRYDHNAFVEGIRTVFFATGTDADHVAFFATTGAALLDLPIAELERERAVLKRESASRGYSAAEAHRHFRFGIDGHGMVAQPEFGLGSVSGERVQGWARERFTRSNAMAFLTGPPPPGLRFVAPDGGRFPAPAPVTAPEVTLPAHIPEGGGGVALGFIVARQLGAGSWLAIYHRRLRQRLRLERGLVYDLQAEYDPLDGDWASALIGGECADDAAQEVSDVAIAELERMAAGEVSQAELDEETADYTRMLGDPTATGGLLDAMVTDELLGMRQRGPEERYEEQRSTTIADVAARAAEARRSLLLLAAIDHHPDDVQAYPTSSSTSVSGREVKPLLSVLGIGPKQRLVIGPDGVTIRAKDGSLATVRYADCVVLERPDDDNVVLWGRDGARVWVPGPFWRGGEAVLAEIMAAVPSDRVIRERLSHDFLDD